MRVQPDETLETQDNTRPVEAQHHSIMLNHCRECGVYKYVYCFVDLHDGKGPGYVCGRCRRERAR